MSDFTYQYGEKKCKKEYFEWDNLWWDNAPDEEADRVLIIGDSISCGFRRILSEIADKKYYVDGLGTSKSLDDPALFPLIEYVLSQEKNLKVIQINHGLHGWHLDDKTEYRDLYLRLIEYIKELCPDVQLVIALTTPTRNSENLQEYGAGIERVRTKNNVARELADSFKIPVNDFFGTIEHRPELYSDDGIHLNEKGYRLLAKQTFDIFSKYI